MSLLPPADELLRTASRPFENAIGMPPVVYTSDDFLALELDRVFGQEWICVGRASALQEPGDYLTHEIAGQPVVVLRGQDGSLRALSNVCLHRMSVLLEESGNTRRIVCPYHGWTYNLDGVLQGAPLMKTTPGFCKEAYALPHIRCEEWLGWIYLTLNHDTLPVAERLRPLAELIASYDMEGYVETFRETHVWNTNWKVLAENFMESYHLRVCHAGTVGPHSRTEEMVCPPGEPTFNYHWITKEASMPIGLAHPDNARLEGDWRRTTALISIYPSHLITLSPGYFWYLSLHPRGTGRVHMIYGGGLAKEFVADPRGGQWIAELKVLLDEVNEEDRCCTERVFRGLNAPAARPGHLSRLERPLYDFMRYLAGRVAGKDQWLAAV